MAEFTIAAPARTCTATGRPLAPGDRTVSALTETPTGYARADFAADAWPGPPAGCVAYWPGKIRASSAAKPPTFPEAMLADWFVHLAGTPDPSKANLRYVVALLLMRKKRLKFEDTKATPGGPVLVVRDAKSGARHEVPDPRLTGDELAAVEAEIGRVLGWN